MTEATHQDPVVGLAANLARRYVVYGCKRGRRLGIRAMERPMKQTPVVAAGLGLLSLACTGCSARTSAEPRPSALTKTCSGPGGGAAPPPTDCASAGVGPPAPSARPSTMAAWRYRLLQRQRPSELIADQAISPATGAAYALISRTATIPLQGPYVLECTELRTGSARHGPVFPVDRLTI